MEFANKRRVGRAAMVSILFVLVTARSAMAAGELDWNTFNNGVFDSSHGIGTDVELITGPISYYGRDDDDFTEGYRPDASRELSGARMRREVYDLPQIWGASGVFSWALARLGEAGFEAVFHCEENACGDVAGWQLFLSELVAGTQKGQRYVLARTSTEPGWSTWVAIYVNEFDGRPRLILDLVVPHENDWMDHRVLSEGAIQFRPGGLQPDESAITSLRRDLKQVDSPGDTKLLILGNADSEGALFMNLWLSGFRARNVREELMEGNELSGRNAIIKPLGSLRPKGDNASTKGRRSNRRVDVMMMMD